MERSSHSKHSSKSAFSRYYNLYRLSPVSIWEEDFSGVKRHFDTLRKEGITDFREYFMANPQEVISLARKVEIISVNSATLKLYDAENQEQLLHGLNKVFNKRSYTVFREELLALADGKTEFCSEAVNRTLRGEEKHILLKLVVLPEYEETLSNVFIYIIDISDLKRLEIRARRAGERYRAIVNAVQDAILILDMESGIILEVNKKAEELTGIPSGEITGMHFSQLFPSLEAHAYREVLGDPENTDRQISGYLSVSADRERETIPVSICASPLKLRGRKYIIAAFREEERHVKAQTDGVCKAVYPLSPREQEILKLIASGLSARQIAESINVSERTVTTHRGRIMRKLRVRKSIDLVRYAIACGLLDGNAAQE